MNGCEPPISRHYSSIVGDSNSVVGLVYSAIPKSKIDQSILHQTKNKQQNAKQIKINEFQNFLKTTDGGNCYAWWDVVPKN